MKILDEIRNGEYGSHILPFFWLHGEPHEILREEIEKIDECGIREFCVESRPHPGFAKEHWWSDLSMIISEAKKRGMRVWILDDDKFPTGHAAGGFERKPEKAKWYLAERHMDIIGPLKDGAVLVENFLGNDGRLLGIYACRVPDRRKDGVSFEDVVDLTGSVTEGMVYLDLPEGHYRLFVLFSTQKFGGREHYMNLIDSESVRVLIDEVYEKHYEHFGEEFGRTIAGFFSDEPELGNVPGYDFDECLGQRNVRLPWSSQLEEILREEFGEELYHLIALWYDCGKDTGKIRKAYMNGVSYLVEHAFSRQVGDWCHEHNVEYIGHVIEDDNAHARLGCSISHYFRSEMGMDMAGIDVVHLEIMPGFQESEHQWIASHRDGEFFHYGLAKLGSSLGHLDERKKGRTLCEIFGSYGWGEGVWLMKWLTDHMLVRGVNTFVPHAFSPKYPDTDCPPHFYARGNNPQYPLFRTLMRYMNRICHLLNGGVMPAQAAVLYHGEAEWSGEAGLFQRPVRRLMERQIELDIVWLDLLNSPETVFEEGKMRIRTQSYSCLIIPQCQCITQELAEFLAKAKKAGFPVLFEETAPKYCLLEDGLSEALEAGEVVPAAEMADKVEALAGEPEIRVEVQMGVREDLRAYAYRRKEGMVYFFFNENTTQTLEGEITLKSIKEKLIRYDGVNNICYEKPGQKNRFRLSLKPGESRIYAEDSLLERNEELLTELQETKDAAEAVVIDGPWDMELRETGIETEFTIKKQGIPGSGLISVNAPGQWPGFSGEIRYSGSFELDEIQPDCRWSMGFPGLYDGAALYINGKKAGEMLGSPYCLEVTRLLKKGTNTVRIDTANTLTWRLHDGQTTHMQLYPTGMVEAPILYRFEEGAE